MDIKNTPVGFIVSFVGSDKKKYVAYRFNHIENPSRMHLMEDGGKYVGRQVLFAFEKKEGVYVEEGKSSRSFAQGSVEFDAFDLLLSAVVDRVVTFKK